MVVAALFTVSTEQAILRVRVRVGPGSIVKYELPDGSVATVYNLQ